MRLHKAFANDSSANTKLRKSQLDKIEILLGLLLKPGLLLIKNVLKSLAKNVLVSLGLKVAAWAKMQLVTRTCLDQVQWHL